MTNVKRLKEKVLVAEGKSGPAKAMSSEE